MKYSIKPIWLVAALLLGGGTWLFFSNIPIAATVFVVIIFIPAVSLYIPYAQNNPKHVWFKRKLYGWGWTPVTWQGWLVTALYIASMALLALTIDENSPTREVIFMFGIPMVLLTSTLLRIAYKKGEKPRWQWGIEDGNKDTKE